MTNPKVSIIIPVFNTAAYLPQCLDSVLAQTLTDWQAICLDDGSTDESPVILARYAQKDPRIQVVTQTNQGLGSTRNNGMTHATGEYLMFLDSDDWVLPDFCARAATRLDQTGSDVGWFNMTMYREDANPKFRPNPCKQEFKTAFGHDLDKQPWFQLRALPPGRRLGFAPSVCDKIFHTRFVQDYGLQCGKVRFSEDQIFSYRALIEADRVEYIDYAPYIYRVRTSSLSQSADVERYALTFASQDALAAWLAEAGLADEFGLDLTDNWLTEYVSLAGALAPDDAIRWVNMVRARRGDDLYAQLINRLEQPPRCSLLQRIFSIKSAWRHAKPCKCLTILGSSFYFK